MNMVKTGSRVMVMIVVLACIVVHATSSVHADPGVVYADQFPGATAGEQILAAIRSLGSLGGTVDARNLRGIQTIASWTDVTTPVTLLFGSTTFNVSATMRFKDVRTVRWLGSGIDVTKFVWVGDNPTTALFELDDVGQGTAFSDFSVSRTTSTLSYFFRMINGNGTTMTPTGRQFSNVFADCGGVVQAAFFWDPSGPGGDANNELDALHHVTAAGCVNAGFFAQGYNAHSYQFYNCHSYGHVNGYGVRLQHGSMHWRGGSFHNNKTDIHLDDSGEPILIEGATSENSRFFLRTGGASGAGSNVTIVATRAFLKLDVNDNEGIQILLASNVTLIGNTLGALPLTSGAAREDFRILANGLNQGSQMVVIGNIIRSSHAQPLLTNRPNSEAEVHVVGNDVEHPSTHVMTRLKVNLGMVPRSLWISANAWTPCYATPTLAFIGGLSVWRLSPVGEADAICAVLSVPEDMESGTLVSPILWYAPDIAAGSDQHWFSYTSAWVVSHTTNLNHFVSIVSPDTHPNQLHPVSTTARQVQVQPLLSGGHPVTMALNPGTKLAVQIARGAFEGGDTYDAGDILLIGFSLNYTARIGQ